MAKRMKSKIQPAELKIAFKIEESGKNYIDISQCASIINRRFYRQGLNWAVSHFTFYKSTPTETGAVGVSVAKLPSTWVLSNSWEKAFRAWQKMNNEALAESPSVKPKFLDFKIFADKNHYALGFGKNLLPTDIEGNLATAGEWSASSIHVPFGPSSPGVSNEYSIMAVGENYNGATDAVVSLINGYANSRGLPYQTDPNTPQDSDDASGSTPENWLSAMFNEGTDQDSQVLNDMISENNQAPYPFENDGSSTDTMYPGGQTQLPAMRTVAAGYFNAGTNANKIVLEGDSFPCGLIQIENATSGSLSVIMHLLPGDHRGYLAEPMTEL